MLEKAKRQYLNSLIDMNKNNTKKTWQIINNIMNGKLKKKLVKNLKKQ